MNKHVFALGLLVSALPLLASARGALSLNQSDFVSARRITRNGEAYLSVKLSKSGKAKWKKLRHAAGEKVHTEIAGVPHDFVVRVPIEGSHFEMGPYETADAEKIVSAVNPQ